MAPTRRRDASGLWWHCEEDEWYAASLAHWSASEGADVLGGCEGVAEADLSGSLDFLRSVAGWAVQGEPVQGSCAMDVGAGCGRVTEGVLLHAFEHVHMVEVSAALIDQARKQLCEHTPRLEITQASLQSFAPIDVQTYDTIWMQWILGHLTDASLVRLLRVCLRALKPSGFIIVKENNAPPSHCREGKGNYLLDKENAAVIRTHAHHMSLFRQAGYRVVAFRRQTAFPKELYPVRMYLLVDAARFDKDRPKRMRHT